MEGSWEGREGGGMRKSACHVSLMPTGIWLRDMITINAAPTHRPHRLTHIPVLPNFTVGFWITAWGAINATLQTMVASVLGKMVVMPLVIGLNLAIALCGFYVAWRLWRLRRTLAAATVALTMLEQEAQLALRPDQASAQILQGRDAIVLTRTRYQRMQRQLRQLRQIFGMTAIILRLVSSDRWPRRLTRNR